MNVLITGANRGVGFELTRLYSKREDATVFAACRNPASADDLRRLPDSAKGTVKIVELEVTNPLSIDRCRGQVGGEADTIDVLINNAGIFGGSVDDPMPQTSSFGNLAQDKMLEVFSTNTIAPVIVAQAFIELLEGADKPRIINVSSDAGSLTLREGKGNFAYVASKTALNMMTRCLAAEVRDAGIIVVSMHPGFLRTDMGGANAPMSVDDTLPTMVRQIEHLSLDESGEFINWDGSTIPW